MDIPSHSATPPFFGSRQLEGSITRLLAELVHIPSRAGVDTCDKIFTFVANWLLRHHLPCHRLVSRDGRVVAITGQVGDGAQGSAYILNATVDTVGFGDIGAWNSDPTDAVVVDGWLHGRGSADSKAGLAIFCHLLDAFQSRSIARPLGFVFDAEEHTGRFGGMRSYLDRRDGSVAGVLIGYPGHDRISVGARGFWRGTLRISGVSAHSGSSRDRGTNAIVKAAHLIAALGELQEELAEDTTEAFPLPPKLTITGIRGGGEFSVVPDSCEVDVDARLTPVFAANDAQGRLQALLEQLDAQHPSPSHSRIVTQDSIPAYRLPADSALADTLGRAGEQILGRRLPFVVTGPSNVGNLLAQCDIPATCGFGVAYRNIHAPDECVDLSSVVPTFRVYEVALEELLGAKKS